jgi:hypothetical protein
MPSRSWWSSVNVTMNSDIGFNGQKLEPGF